MPHAFTFVRLGGFDQVTLERGADLAALHELDPKLWATLSCPVKGLTLDPRTLERIDTDGDGRIRVPEVLAAVRFALDRLNDADALARGIDPLPLSMIRAAEEPGRSALAAARAMLETLGRSGASAISVEEAEEAVGKFDARPFNGDGAIVPACATEPALADLIRRIVALTGGVPDRSGAPGLDAATIEKFYADLGKWLAWRKAGRTDGILPLGERTSAAAAAVAACRAKVDDHFARVGLADFDERAANILSPRPEQFAEFTGRTLETRDAAVAAMPLARILPGEALPLDAGVNPAWRDALADLVRDAVEPLLGARKALTREEWTTLLARLAPYETWLTADPAPAFAGLEESTAEEWLAKSRRAELLALVARDQERAAERAALDSTVTLVRLARDLSPLLNNFVTLRDFYRDRAASFQAGTLYLDGRSMDLCLRVDDPGTHAAAAAAGACFLVYCQCARAGEPPIAIACAVTDGEAAGLSAGRNALFVDRAGRDWHATVVRTVEHPVSLREAFFAPWRKAAALVGDAAAKFAGEKAAAADANLAGTVAAPAAAPAPFDIAKLAGIFAAVGLALGALGTALATMVAALLALPAWQIPLALAGFVLLLSGPSMLIAWLKLRRRSLGPLLDASGFAVNSSARITVPFGRTLTALPELPEGAKRQWGDPYAERDWLRTLFIILIVSALIVLAILLHPAARTQAPVVKRDVSPAVVELRDSTAPAPPPPPPPAAVPAPPAD